MINKAFQYFEFAVGPQVERRNKVNNDYDKIGRKLVRRHKAMCKRYEYGEVPYSVILESVLAIDKWEKDFQWANSLDEREAF
jgi:hypothetical protein